MAAQETVSDRQVLFAVLEYLADLSSSRAESLGIDRDSLDVAIQCLGGAVGLSLDDAGQRSELSVRSKVTLRDALAAALQSAPSSAAGDAAAPPDGGHRFDQFIKKLTDKGFFDGVAPNTAEYDARFAKAKARFVEKYGGTAPATASSAGAAAAAPAAPKVAAAPTPEQKQQAEMHKQRGNDALNASNTEEAYSHYTEAIGLDPTNHIYFGNRAAALLHLERFEEAVADCDRALALDPTYLKVALRKARALERMGRASDAISTAEAAMKSPHCDAKTREQLKQAADEWRARSARDAADSGDGLPGFGGAGGGMPDIASLLSNPEIMRMAAQFMGGMGGGGGGAAAGGGRAGADAAWPGAPGGPGGPTNPSGGGGAGGPLGGMVEQVRSRPEYQALRSDPEMVPVLQAFESGGPAALLPFMGNQRVLAKLRPLMGSVLGGLGGGMPPQ